MTYYKNNINNNKISFKSMINNFEMDSLKIFATSNYLFFEKDHVNIHFIEPYCQKYLEEYNYPIIKIKKLQYTIYTDINKNFNENPFNPEIYKSLNPDLTDLNDNELKEHFLIHGINEGRKYYINQPTILPEYLKCLVKNII